jgi:hypothetical protein
VAAELDGGADVQADTAIARATAAPKTPAALGARRCLRPRHDHGLVIAFPTDPMLAGMTPPCPPEHRRGSSSRSSFVLQLIEQMGRLSKCGLPRASGQQSNIRYQRPVAATERLTALRNLFYN